MLHFRWKRLLIPAVLGGVLFLAPDDSFGQRPGGGGGGFGGGGNPGGGGGGVPGGGGGFGGGGGGRGGFGGGNMADSSFDRLMKSYGGTGDTLDYSKVPADVRTRNDSFAKVTGSAPMPTTGSISRTEFKADFDKRMSSFGKPGGGAPGGPAAPKPADGGVVVITSGADGKPVTTIPGGGVPGGGVPGGGVPGGGGGWGGGGFGGGGQTTADSRFKQMDTNQDGKISRDEAKMSTRLATAFDQTDTDKDGFLTLVEYTPYYTAATGGGGGGGGGGGWGGGGGGGGGWGGGGQNPEARKTEEPEEPKPVVYKFGNLPGNLPGYFTSGESGGDSDKDGQISLYEWVKYWDSTEAKLTEFKKLDLNGDSLLTAEEYLRANKLVAVAPGAGGNKGGWGGGGPGWGQPQQPPPTDGTIPPPVSPGDQLTDPTKKPADPTKKDDKKEEKKEEKRPGGFGKPGDAPTPNGDTKQPGSGRQRPGGGGDTKQPGGDTKQPGGGGGNPFNPGGRGNGGK